jgi:Domain of unknown function (DUF4412)
MLNKITIGVVVLVVAVGAFWFFYYEQGANKPITIEGTLTASGTGMPMAVNAAEVNLYATPKKLKINAEINKEKVDLILRLDKEIILIIDHSSRKYAEIEFKYVDKDKVKSPGDSTFKWEDLFDIKVDTGYVGEESDKIFCRKLSLKNAPGKYEMWLTRDIRIGRSYIKAVNKLLKIDPVNMPNMSTGGGGKRPQIRYQNMEYFPIPLKLDVSMSQGQYRVNMKWEAKKVSRKSIAKSEFEVPSGFTKVGIMDLQKQFMQQAQQQMPVGARRR